MCPFRWLLRWIAELPHARPICTALVTHFSENKKEGRVSGTSCGPFVVNAANLGKILQVCQESVSESGGLKFWLCCCAFDKHRFHPQGNVRMWSITVTSCSILIFEDSLKSYVCVSQVWVTSCYVGDMIVCVSECKYSFVIAGVGWDALERSSVAPTSHAACAPDVSATRTLSATRLQTASISRRLTTFHAHVRSGWRSGLQAGHRIARSMHCGVFGILSF